jgi:hypothetical protein
VAARSFLSFPSGGPALAEALHAGAIVVGALGCLAGATRDARLRIVVPLALGLVLGQLGVGVVQGADTANHVFLEAILLAFFALCRVERKREAELLVQAVRFTFAIFLFYTGLQKVLYGHYFDGRYLAYLAATYDSFELVFSPLIPADELARLQAGNELALGAGRQQAALGAGPYRVASPIFVALSNAVYLLEMLLGSGLLARRLRPLAALGGIGLIVAIQAGARELAFGGLAVNVLLSFLPGPWVRRAFPASVAFYLYLVLAEHGGLGLLPMFRYAPS